MIADLIIVSVIVLFTLIGVLRGFLRTLFNLIGTAVNLFLANFLSGKLAAWIYTALIRQSILSSLETEITKNGYSDTLAHSFRSVPSWMNAMISSIFAPFGVSLSDLQQGVVINQGQAQAIAQSIEQPLGAIITAALSMVLMTLLFVILTVILKLILHAVTHSFRGVPIGGINRFFGGIFGLLEGIVFVCIAINLFYVIMTYASPAFFQDPQAFGTLFRALCVYI